MKISTEIGSAAKLVSEEKAIEYYAKVGFDAWDLTMFFMCRYDWSNGKLMENDHPLAGSHYLTFVRRLKQIGLDHGISCNQSHAPMPVYCKQIRSYMKRAIECTAEAGGKICVIHPDNFKSAEENAVNDEHFVACLDIGHAEMKGMGTNAVEMIRALGPRLQALHIHDNDQLHDSHQIPGSMQINFPAVVKALKGIGYSGYFTLEADRYLSKFDCSNISVGIKKLADSAKWLAEMFEND